MIDASVPPPPAAPAPARSRWLPFGDRSRKRRVAKVLAWLAGIALAVGVLALAGVDVSGWFSQLWDALTEPGLGYVLAGWALQTVQTTMTALGWFAILRAAFPAAPVGYPQVLAAYAAGVAMNGFLPANIGTVVTLLMFVAIIPGATLPGVLGGMVVQKIFFTVAGAFVYAYLFLSVPGRSSSSCRDRTIIPCWRSRSSPAPSYCSSSSAASSGASSAGSGQRPSRAGDPRPPARVRGPGVLPSFVAWLAKLGVIAVFLAGYGITVTLPLGDVGDGRQLDREHRVGHPRRRRREPGRPTSRRSTTSRTPRPRRRTRSASSSR